MQTARITSEFDVELQLGAGWFRTAIELLVDKGVIDTGEGTDQKCGHSWMSDAALALIFLDSQRCSTTSSVSTSVPKCWNLPRSELRTFG